MKKLLFFTPFLISFMMGFISCSQDEEIIVDPILGYVETTGELSQEGETFYFTIEEVSRVYDPITERWDTIPAEEKKDDWSGTKVMIDPPSQNDSVIQRKLTENIDKSVQLLCNVETFWNALDRPEYQATHVFYVSEIDDNTRSVETDEEDESDYFNPDPSACFFKPQE